MKWIMIYLFILRIYIFLLNGNNDIYLMILEPDFNHVSTNLCRLREKKINELILFRSKNKPPTSLKDIYCNYVLVLLVSMVQRTFSAIFFLI